MRPAVSCDSTSGFTRPATTIVVRLSTSGVIRPALRSSSGGANLCEADTLRLARCTLSGNHTAGAGSGGAIHCSATPTLSQCKISANTAQFEGSGLKNSAGGQATLVHCIVFGNTAPTNQGKDIFNTGFTPSTITFVGANIPGSIVNEFSDSSSGPAPISADPLLSPLADHGGPTQSMTLQTGSPAVNTATGSSAINNQRGYFLFSYVDRRRRRIPCGRRFVLPRAHLSVAAQRLAGDEHLVGCPRPHRAAWRRCRSSVSRSAHEPARWFQVFAQQVPGHLDIVKRGKGSLGEHDREGTRGVPNEEVPAGFLIAE